MTKSNLARKCAPPALPQGFSANSILNIFLVGLVVAFLNWMFGGSYVSWFIATVITLIAWNGIYVRWIKEETKLHSAAMGIYEKTFVCMRCGKRYQPFD